jgi:hypothetical protein
VNLCGERDIVAMEHQGTKFNDEDIIDLGPFRNGRERDLTPSWLVVDWREKAEAIKRNGALSAQALAGSGKPAERAPLPLPPGVEQISMICTNLNSFRDWEVKNSGGLKDAA